MSDVLTTTDAIVIELDFDASPAALYERWTSAQYLPAWFAAEGYTTIACEVDARPGGAWSLTFRRHDGAHTYVERGEFRALEPGRRVVMTLTQVGLDEHGPETLVTATFSDLDGGERTRMRFEQTGFTSREHRDGNDEGWRGCFRKLAHALPASDPAAQAAEQEIRDLFRAWSDASAVKDLDASMTPIAADVLAYEHQAPLAYHGADALRPICAAGFEAQPDHFRWDVPDLQVIIRGDIAITWGLNRMRSETPGEAAHDMWSRGTRIFQQRDGKWTMIHQHVSFPMDPATGAVITR
jgi:uncharacterized protein YndB with AHSA1/START domain/ketosteroid isomerase-like protein